VGGRQEFIHGQRRLQILQKVQLILCEENSSSHSVSATDEELEQEDVDSQEGLFLRLKCARPGLAYTYFAIAKSKSQALTEFSTSFLSCF
jgi:hypothetical protein